MSKTAVTVLREIDQYKKNYPSQTRNQESIQVSKVDSPTNIFLFPIGSLFGINESSAEEDISNSEIAEIADNDADDQSSDDGAYIEVDRYGFYVDDKYHHGIVLSQEEISLRREKEVERTKKWLKMINKWSFTVAMRKSKLKRRIRKGIPDNVFVLFF